MSLIALNKTGTRIDITLIENPKKELNPDDIYCQLCGEKMFVKHGAVKQKHFSHFKICESDYENKPESQDHLSAKAWLANKLRIKNKGEVFLEYKIEETKRIADVLIVLQDGGAKMAYEIQLSPIGIKDLEDRTNDYDKAGIEVYWCFGKKAYTESNKAWSMEKFGKCFAIEFEDFTERHNSFDEIDENNGLTP